jgi:hypothetical protein
VVKIEEGPTVLGRKSAGGKNLNIGPLRRILS